MFFIYLSWGLPPPRFKVVWIPSRLAPVRLALYDRKLLREIIRDYVASQNGLHEYTGPESTKDMNKSELRSEKSRNLKARYEGSLQEMEEHAPLLPPEFDNSSWESPST